MTLTQFKYVLEIAKAGSVNQAANNLFVSQSVLSNSIKALENELGQKIFFAVLKECSQHSLVKISLPILRLFKCIWIN